MPPDEDTSANHVALTMVANELTPQPSPSLRSVHSIGRKQKASITSHGSKARSLRKQVSSMETTMLDLSHRLTKKKFLHDRLTLISDLMCTIGILGIVLMIIENELSFTRLNDSDTQASWFIKLVITLSTAVLVGLIVYYHRLDLDLFCNQNSLNDWRIGLSVKRVAWILLEIGICVVHPVPRLYPSSHPPPISQNATDPVPLSYTPTDVGLGLPMFLRIYLLGRSAMFHSYLVRDGSVRSLGYLNHVPINFFFLLKTFLEQWPTRCMLFFCTVSFFIGSWCLRACNYRVDLEHQAIGDAMWLFIVTFCTIGYGDLYPTTTCGRSIASIIGLVGIIASALLIAVLAQKLTMTREEKYVHTFVLNIELAKKRLHLAANILKFSMKIWFLKRKNKAGSLEFYEAQQKLFKSVYELQQIKKQQRNLTGRCLGLSELMNTQQKAASQMDDTAQQLLEMRSQMKRMDEQLSSMNAQFELVQKSLHVLLETAAK